MSASEMLHSLAQQSRSIVFIGILAVSASPNTLSPSFVEPIYGWTTVINGVLGNQHVSRPSRLPYEQQSWEEMRMLKIRSIRGKYASVPTSSEEFIRRKWEEMQREEL